MIEIAAVGGYSEVGKNMTAVKVEDQTFLFDMGLHMENYIKFTQDEEEDVMKLKAKDLAQAGAIPDVSSVRDWSSSVKAIIPSHAHLDHVGAIPFLSEGYAAPIIGTPFTTAVIKTVLREEHMKLHNRLNPLHAGSSLKIGNAKLEFIHITHSTPQTVVAALHTPKGVILYANDFKLDISPVMGKGPDFKRLEEVGKKGVLALIVDSTYSDLAQRTPSEFIAKQLLKETLSLRADKGIIVSTFSSHISRLKSIIELGQQLDRKVVFLGRSISKYVQAAESVGLVQFSRKVEIIKYGSKIKKKLRQIEKEGKENYLIVATGHQGEPNSTLSKMASGELGFRLEHDDHVIFSCKTIPTPTNIANREALEKNLARYGVRIFTDVHVSGHAAREDLREFIRLVKPQHIIPAHAHFEKRNSLKSLAEEMRQGTVHMLENGQRTRL